MGKNESKMSAVDSSGPEPMGGTGGSVEERQHYANKSSARAKPVVCAENGEKQMIEKEGVPPVVVVPVSQAEKPKAEAPEKGHNSEASGIQSQRHTATVIR